MRFVNPSAWYEICSAGGNQFCPLEMILRPLEMMKMNEMTASSISSWEFPRFGGQKRWWCWLKKFLSHVTRVGLQLIGTYFTFFAHSVQTWVVTNNKTMLLCFMCRNCDYIYLVYYTWCMNRAKVLLEIELANLCY